MCQTSPAKRHHSHQQLTEQQLQEPPSRCMWPGQRLGNLGTAAGGEAQGAGQGVWLRCRNPGARPCSAYTRALHNAAPRQVSSGQDGHTSKPWSGQRAGPANPPLVTPAPLTLSGGSWGKVAQPGTALLNARRPEKELLHHMLGRSLFNPNHRTRGAPSRWTMV